MMHDMTRETMLLIKAAGIVVGQCLFGLFGPLLLIHPLHWFEINLPGAIAIGVVVGAVVGYGVAIAALRLRGRETASGQQRRPMAISTQLGANLHA
jgi:hypothetical protein